MFSCLWGYYAPKCNWTIDDKAKKYTARRLGHLLQVSVPIEPFHYTRYRTVPGTVLFVWCYEKWDWSHCKIVKAKLFLRINQHVEGISKYCIPYGTGILYRTGRSRRAKKFFQREKTVKLTTLIKFIAYPSFLRQLRYDQQIDLFVTECTTHTNTRNKNGII